MSRISAALSSTTHHAIPPEFGRKWGTECLNTRFPLPTLLCAGYRVKLIKKTIILKLFAYRITYIIVIHLNDELVVDNIDVLKKISKI